MDIRKVKKLIELLEESGIAEIEITEGEEGVRISRFPKGGMPMMAAPYPVAAPAPLPAAPVAGAAAPAAPAAPEAPKGHQVTAPMVGTFYASPARSEEHTSELQS